MKLYTNHKRFTFFLLLFLFSLAKGNHFLKATKKKMGTQSCHDMKLSYYFDFVFLLFGTTEEKMSSISSTGLAGLFFVSVFVFVQNNLVGKILYESVPICPKRGGADGYQLRTFIFAHLRIKKSWKYTLEDLNVRSERKKRQERKKRKKGKFFTSASLGPIIGHKFLAPATREIEWIARTTWFKFWASKRSIVWKRSFLGTPSFSQWRRKLLMFSIFLFGLLFASASFFFFFLFFPPLLVWMAWWRCWSWWNWGPFGWKVRKEEHHPWEPHGMKCLGKASLKQWQSSPLLLVQHEDRI